MHPTDRSAVRIVIWGAMEVWAWWTIAGLCVSGAMSPGPSLAVVVKNTVAGGRSQGVATGVGHGLGVGLYAFGAVAGVSALLQAWPALERGLSVAGGLYLVWLGAGALRGGGEVDGDEPATAGGFTEGFLMAFLNPKIAVFFLALLGSFVPDASGLGTRAGVALLALSIDMSWYVAVALVLAQSGGAVWLAARGRALAVGTGLLLLVAGAAVVVGALLG